MRYRAQYCGDDLAQEFPQPLEDEAEVVADGAHDGVDVDMLEFDVATAYQLYEKLLKPIEEAWWESKTIIVITNGALSTLPLSVLPTRSVTPERDGSLPFSRYRKISWLAKSHAVVVLPSVASLTYLHGGRRSGSESKVRC